MCVKTLSQRFVFLLLMSSYLKLELYAMSKKNFPAAKMVNNCLPIIYRF